MKNLLPWLQEMQEEEEVHLAEFDRLMKEHRVRPTVLMPVWDVAGYMLGLLLKFLNFLFYVCGIPVYPLARTSLATSVE